MESVSSYLEFLQIVNPTINNPKIDKRASIRSNLNGLKFHYMKEFGIFASTTAIIGAAEGKKKIIVI